MIALDTVTWDHRGHTYEVSVPGYLDGVPMDAYHASPGVSASGLSQLLKSPAHYDFSRRRGFDGTQATLLGSLRHTLLLEPEEFDRLYYVAPKVDRRTKAGKAAWAQSQEEAGSRTIVTEEDLENARIVVNAVERWPYWRTLKGEEHAVERSYWWNDEDTGVLCRCRPDVVQFDQDGYAVVLDLKTTTEAGPRAFQSQALRYGYHRAAAHYQDGVQAVTGRRTDWVAVVAEYTPPFAVAAYRLAAADGIMPVAILGMGERKKALELFAKCSSRDEWPGYADGEITDLTLPVWAQREADELASTVIPAEPF